MQKENSFFFLFPSESKFSEAKYTKKSNDEQMRAKKDRV